jgi:hypothetical protein
MPHDDTIKNYLAKQGYNTVTKTQEDMGRQLTQLKNYLEAWIKENLDPVQGIINVESKTIEYPLKGVDDIKFPSIDFSSVWGKGIFLLLAGIVITSIPGFGFVIGAGSVFLDLIFGKEERHAKRVGKVIDKVDTVYSKAFADAEFQFKEIVAEQMKSLIEYVNRKLTLYFSDIDRQINSYDLSSNFDYIAFEKNAGQQIPEIQNRIDDIWKELQGHLAATKLLS